MPPIKLSVVIITFNEENNIERCLNSIKEVADEIVVLDSYSSDKTADICKHYNATFIQHEFLGHIEQKNKALSHAKYDYVLSLDADEALSPELSLSIQKIKKHAQHKAYNFNRLTFYENTPIKTCGWYPDTKIRLWNTKIGKWGGINPHDKVILEKSIRVKHLDGDLFHYSFSDFKDYLDRQIKYAKVAGQAYYQANERFYLFKLLINPSYRFIRDYFFNLGFTEGTTGLMISVVSAFSVFIKYYTYFKLKKDNQTSTTTLIIATYNWPEALELILLSIIKQIKIPDEIIISDDGSSSQTRSLINRYKPFFKESLIHCWHEDSGFRLSEIRNKAINMASKDVIIQIDGDVILHPSFISDHLKTIKRGYYTQGSRVLLSDSVSKQALANKITKFSPFQKGITNKLNTMHSLFFGQIIGKRKTKLKGVRGCNMAFWKKDLLEVNGYNQDITGWGKEDSELVVRLFNRGIKRKNLKFGGIQYHIYHPENSRKHLKSNIKILENSIKYKKTWCENGIMTPTK